MHYFYVKILILLYTCWITHCYEYVVCSYTLLYVELHIVINITYKSEYCLYVYMNLIYMNIFSSNHLSSVTRNFY